MNEKVTTFKLFLFFKLCMCTYVYTRECRCPQKPDSAVGSPGAEVLGSCELSDVGAKNQTLKEKNSTISKPLSHNSSPESNCFLFLRKGSQHYTDKSCLEKKNEKNRLNIFFHVHTGY